MDRNNIIGLPFDKIFLTEYREEWILIFNEERKKISEILSVYKNYIEHIGSTAITGMIAKPIIDIMVGMEKNEDLVAGAELLETIGYLNFGECGRPGRIFMVKGEPENCTHHLHLVKKGSSYWADNLFFREYMKNNKCKANKYRRLKLDLAEQFRDNRAMYRILKSKFVEEIICNHRHRAVESKAGSER